MGDEKISLKPSEFLRARRPERYSDSVLVSQPLVSRDMLEYHLDTLTNRSQEHEFETFARRLIEKSICPNLLPQTGPTGGGDSKVDSETYPVANEIAIRWFHGDASARERWAFAFSAKKDWRPKVRGDVKKIVETNRDYTLIYFVTNQFVRDKVRAEVEDELSKEYGIDVRILDRNWIVDKVLSGDHLELITKTLSMESLSFQERIIRGPLDTKRELELKELDARISNPDCYKGISFQLAEDCLSAAILASELERDRYEIDGRFNAAYRVAKEVDDKRQLLRIKYHQAWITCFLFDDFAELIRLYDEVETLALEEHIVDHIQKLQNLWNVLLGLVVHGEVAQKDAKLDERGERIRLKLSELAGDQSRPNNALNAETLLCLSRLGSVAKNGESLDALDEIFFELIDIFRKSEGLGQYPFDDYKEYVFGIGDLLGTSQAFEQLFECTLEILEKRKSEGEVGVALLKRGIQKLRAGRPYDSIRLLGRAQERLIKEEYRGQLITSLVACAAAYQEVGLNWAARANLLAGLSDCISKFHESGRLRAIALSAAFQLSWCDLRIGRVPHILFDFALAHYLAGHLQLDQDESEEFGEFVQDVDAILSMILLKADIDQLSTMQKLPVLLGDRGLYCSMGAMFLALGANEELIQLEWLEPEGNIEKIEEFYRALCSQKINKYLSERCETYNSKRVSIISNVLGAKWTITADNNPTSILVSESIFSSLEAFLATSLSGEIMPYKSDIAISVSQKENIADVGLEICNDVDDYILEIRHSPNFALTDAEKMSTFRSLLVNFVTEILQKVCIYDEESNHIKKLAEQESLFGRSFLFSDVVTLSGNVFGGLDWQRLDHWTGKVEEGELELKRRTKWIPGNLEEDTGTLRPGSGEMPEELADVENYRHDERKIFSLINIPLWNEAVWRGAGFLVFPDGQLPPTIGLLFENEDASRKIFREWREVLGELDEKNLLRLSVVTGVDEKMPFHYRLHIGTNMEAIKNSGFPGHAVMFSRIQTMTPVSEENLKAFLSSYEKFKHYFLVPAILNKSSNEPIFLRDMKLLKNNLVVRPAWQIGENDSDYLALQPDDKPIVPSEIDSPPVLKALARRREKVRKSL